MTPNRESDDTRTDRQTDRQTQTDFIICPIAICYSYGADENWPEPVLIELRAIYDFLAEADHGPKRQG